MTPIEHLERLLADRQYASRRVRYGSGYFLTITAESLGAASAAFFDTIRTFFPLALPWSDYELVVRTPGANVFLAAQLFPHQSTDQPETHAVYLYDSDPVHRTAMKAWQTTWNVV